MVSRICLPAAVSRIPLKNGEQIAVRDVFSGHAVRLHGLGTYKDILEKPRILHAVDQGKNAMLGGFCSFIAESRGLKRIGLVSESGFGCSYGPGGNFALKILDSNGTAIMLIDKNATKGPRAVVACRALSGWKGVTERNPKEALAALEEVLSGRSNVWKALIQDIGDEIWTIWGNTAYILRTAEGIVYEPGKIKRAEFEFLGAQLAAIREAAGLIEGETRKISGALSLMRWKSPF